MNIGSHKFQNNLVLAPMAGVTDKPFRQLCLRLGAGVAVSEMITSNPELYKTRKTKLRMDHSGESGVRVVQIAGADPKELANAAKFNVEKGADIIDINMGCPAKKVCNVMAGSALLKDEKLVSKILDTVVNAVDVPVTLKIRTGWSTEQNNAVNIANLAEAVGIQALTVHGRSRACGFKGRAEHETTRLVKQSVSIPVIANGDIATPEEAARVLSLTGADGIMIGRAAQGNPWIFREIENYLKHGKGMAAPTSSEIKYTLCTHLGALYDFYGEYQGVRIARKHIGWYYKNNDASKPFRALINQVESSEAQLRLVCDFFDQSQYQELVA